MSGGEILVVTGGCGFLGRHLVRQLAEGKQPVKEIRVVDISDPPKNFFVDFQVPVRFIKVDITEATGLDEPFAGADTVIHTAAVVGTGFHDNPAWQEKVNIEGTRNVVAACVRQNVPILVATSSSEISRRFDEHRVNADESALDKHLSEADQVTGGYGYTKKLAEDIVIEAHGLKLTNGKQLRTISLNPCGIWGEGDHKYIYSVVLSAKVQMGYLPYVGPRETVMQRIYVGNVAWAHIVAWQRLRETADVGGQRYLLTDDAAPSNNFTFVHPFVRARGYRPLDIVIPIALAYIGLLLLEIVAAVLKPLCKVPVIASKNELVLCALQTTYDGAKARKVLGYAPRYAPDEALRNGQEYYATCDLVIQ